MKKALSLILALVLCLSLCACGNSSDTPSTADDPNNGINGEVDNSNSENNIADTSWLVRGDTVNVAKLRECVEIVELTTENWNQHFKVYAYSYTEEKVEKDAFGEVVSTETITHNGRAFGAGNERYHGYDDVVIELKDKTTGELTVYQFDPFYGDLDKDVDESFNFDNYECTRIKGSIYYLTIPMGEIPVATMLWPVFQEELMMPGCLEIHPGTNAFSAYYVKDWLS